MSRTAFLTFLAVVIVTAGCGKSSSSRPAVEPDESLPVLQPKSGGEMVLLPAGSFTMGDSTGRPDETPHTVSVSSFYVDKNPVTQELYETILGVNPSKRKAPKNPVERTQWTDAVRFCNKCSELDGLTPCYNLETWECNFTADGQKHDWRAEITAALAKRQRADGSWVNEKDKWMEGDPHLVTGYALMTLGHCKPKK